MTVIIHKIYQLENLLPKYTYVYSHTPAHIQTHIYTCVCVCVCVCANFFSKRIRKQVELLNKFYCNDNLKLKQKGKCIHPTPQQEQDTTHGQFVSKVLFVWILSFPSPRLIDLPRLEMPLCPATYSLLVEMRWIHIYPKGISAKWKANGSVQDLKGLRYR